MALSGKMEADVEIKASAQIFHDLLGGRPHHMPNATEKLQSCELHEGEFGKHGSVVYWNYVHEGVPKVAKELVELDDANLTTTYTVTEGDLMKEYKAFKFIAKATPKAEGCTVHWTIEYEKLNENIPEPHSMLEFAVHLSKDLDEHLAKA
ncbi:MLP-like protein 31 [Mercurialis annua]|uniref:MLP-like protein 31 n=1 Tax=Mercurialis annua TaxID=3986 RepID=UPI00215ECC18|nr:MLP-like protein 31 [Mercurialis annua]